MTKLFLRRAYDKGPFLRPSDGPTEEYVTKMRSGDIIRAVVSRPRNPRHHAKMFALLNLVWKGTDLQDRFPKMENLLDALKHALGHVEVFQAVDGTTLTKPKSINFESMGQDEFISFYNGVVEIVCTQLVPHIDREDLEREVERMVGK